MFFVSVNEVGQTTDDKISPVILSRRQQQQQQLGGEKTLSSGAETGLWWSGPVPVGSETSSHQKRGPTITFKGIPEQPTIKRPSSMNKSCLLGI